MKTLLCSTLVSGLLLLTLHAEETLQNAYGVAAHVSRSWENRYRERTFEILNEMNIRNVRTDFDWWGVEWPQGNWKFQHLDKMYESAGKQNITILPILTGGVKWWHAFGELEKWQDYVSRLVRRYQSKSPYWEVWNEPNQTYQHKPKAGEYAALLRASYQTIKEINPELKVLYGGTDGVPLNYIEETFRNGAKDSFDIINVHPYHKGGVPEETLLPQLASLRKLMNAYGVDRDIWITEVGDNTALNPDIYREPLAAAFKEIGIDPARTVLTSIDFADSPGLDTAIRFPKFKSVHRIGLSDLKSLKPKEYPVLLPCKREAFNMEYLDDLRNYVKHGGTVIFPAGLPLYYNILPAKYGAVRYAGNGWRYSSMLHIGWDTFWINKNCPTKILSTEAAEPFKEIITNPVHRPTSRFLTDRYLKENDRFIPLLYGINGEFRGVTAALYKMNSDLKGNVIVFTTLAAGDSITEQRQAEVLPRYFILAFSGGVKKVFWYNFRSFENSPGNPESHYGIMRKDLRPKPAYYAYKTLVELLPDGSTYPTMKQDGAVYTADWKRPDGVKVRAVWTAMDRLPYTFSLPSPLRKAVGFTGKEVSIPVSGSIVRMTASPEVTYFLLQ